MNKEELTIDNKEKYSVEDISVILNCGTCRAKQIRNEIAEKLKLKISKYLKINKSDLFDHVSENYSEEFIIRKEITKEAILNKIFIDNSDIKVLLNCNLSTASRMIMKTKELMIQNGLKPLGDTVLTKYLIKYLSNENITY